MYLYTLASGETVMVNSIQDLLDLMDVEQDVDTTIDFGEEWGA